MLGYDPADLADKTIADVTHGDDVARVSAELKRLWNGEIHFVDLEKRYLRKDGSFLWVRMTTALVREGDATPSTRSSSCATSAPARNPPKNSNACTSSS